MNLINYRCWLQIFLLKNCAIDWRPLAGSIMEETWGSAHNKMLQDLIASRYALNTMLQDLIACGYGLFTCVWVASGHWEGRFCCFGGHQNQTACQLDKLFFMWPCIVGKVCKKFVCYVDCVRIPTHILGHCTETIWQLRFLFFFFFDR